MSRAPKGNGTVVKKGKKFLAKFPIGRLENPATGRCDTKYESQTFATKSEAQRWLNKMIAAKQNGQLAVGGKQTFRSYADQILLNGVLKVSPRTADGYYRNLRKHVYPVFGRKNLTEIEPSELDLFFSELRKTKAAPTVNAVRTAISAVFKNAMRQRKVTYNPVAHTSKAKRDPFEPTQVRVPWSEEEIREVLRAVEDKPFEAFFKLDISTGLRRGELLGLRWQDVDFENETASIEQTIHRESRTYSDGTSSSQVVIAPPKTASSRRVVRLSPPVLDALRRHKLAQDVNRAMAGDKWIDSGLVFTNSIGGPEDESNLYRRYLKFLEKHEIRRIRIHDMRHTFATVLISNDGGNLPGVSRGLGHSSLSITMDIYGKTAQVEDQAFCRMSEIVFPEYGQVFPKKVPPPQKPTSISPWFLHSS